MADTTRTVEITVRAGTRTVTSESFTVTTTDAATAAGEIDLAANTTNHLVTLAVDVSDLKLVTITSDLGDVTIKTNSSGSPAETIVVGPTKPFVWAVGSPLTNAFATDLTALYLTNTTATTFTYEFVETTT